MPGQLPANSTEHPEPAAGLLMPMLVGVSLAFLAIAVAILTHAGWEPRWLFATRWTARVSLILFAAAYVLRSANARRAAGLSFAGAHFVHAGTFILYLASYDVSRGLLSTVGGSIGYVVLTAMVVMTFVPMPASQPIQRWGMMYLWLVFTSSYLGRLMENGDRRGEGVFGILVLIAIPLVRMYNRRANAT